MSTVSRLLARFLSLVLLTAALFTLTGWSSGPAGAADGKGGPEAKPKPSAGAPRAPGAERRTPVVHQIGAVAGQDLDFCRTSTLPANDDGSTEAVPIPFDLKFFGTTYTELFVNNNGNVTFNSPLSQYTPSSLTGATDRPIIAPFFADVDTRGAGSSLVTYGSSPDGRTFCVNWDGVGYYSSHTDKLNTFQLLLTQNTVGAGRGPGDFDITFNYDQVLWETGDASSGSGGLGGTSAAVGFSAGTGIDGTFVQLPGSFVNGALLDGGPDALVAHSMNSTQMGRYVFQVRNEGLQTILGDLDGTVLKDADSSPVDHAYVQACRTNNTGCAYTYTGADGGYAFTALLAGQYALRVWPPTSDLFGGGGLVDVVPAALTTAPTIRLAAPAPPPAEVSITSNGTAGNGVPSVYYGEPLTLAIDGCPAIIDPTYTVTLADGTVLRDHLPMTESPAGHYSAVIAQFYPNHGDAVISSNVPITCGQDPVSFNVYIDPSGIVTDQYGRPIEGASVTLLRSDTSDGTYTEVPDGSDIMAPSNQDNPSTTDADGFFQWDVQVGWYKVRAETTACGPETTPGMEVPPERIDLLIKLTCTTAAPDATTPPSITGLAKVGSAITPVAATWPAPLVATTTELLRNGTPVTLSGGSYTLVPGDAGAEFTARTTAARPDYTQENGGGGTVTFDPVTATSAPVTGQPADPVVIGDPPTAAAPTLTGSGKVGTTLGAPDPAWSVIGVTTTRQWRVDGTAVPGATGTTYEVRPADVGKSITVRYVGTKPGLSDGAVFSNPVLAILGDAPTATTLPAISGDRQAGQTLSASTGTWDQPDLTFGYQWSRDGVAVPGATAATYPLSVADAGRTITVTVTATRAGYHDGTATSPAVTIGKLPARFKIRVTPHQVVQGRKVKVFGTVKVHGDPAPTGVVTLLDRDEALGTYTLTPDDEGMLKFVLDDLAVGRHRLGLAYAGSDTVKDATSRKVTVEVVPRHAPRLVPNLW